MRTTWSFIAAAAPSSRRPPARAARLLVFALATGAVAAGPWRSLAAAPAPAQASAASAARPSAPEGRIALKGEIVDLGCYLMHEGRGDTHVACAQACVKGGAPVGLLAEGALYVLFAPHETTAPFEEAKRLVGKSAIVTGVVHDRGGLKGLAVTMVAERSPG